MSWVDAIVPGNVVRAKHAAEKHWRKWRAHLGGTKRAATMTREEKVRFASFARIGGKARARTMTPEFLHRLQVMGGRASQAIRKPEQRLQALASANRALTTEQRRANGLKGALVRLGHVRKDGTPMMRKS